MKINTAFLDIDGVLRDFHLEAIRAHLRDGKHFPQINHYGAPLELSSQKVLKLWQNGLSLQKWLGIKDLIEFWRPIRRDPTFWNNLPSYYWMKDLVKLVQTYCHDIVLCTHADFTPFAHGGNRHWLAANGLGQLEHITFTGEDANGKQIGRKWRLAAPDAVLIDDFTGHIKSWRTTCQHRYRCNGKAILFPQPWNENYHIEDRLAFVELELKRFIEMEQV